MQFTHPTARDFINDNKNLTEVLLGDQQEPYRVPNPHQMLCDFHLSQTNSWSRESLQMLLYHAWYLEHDTKMSTSHHLKKLLRNNHTRLCVRKFITYKFGGSYPHTMKSLNDSLDDSVFLLFMTAILADLCLPIREHAAAFESFGQAQTAMLQLAAVRAPLMRSALGVDGSRKCYVLQEVLRHSKSNSATFYGESLIQLTLARVSAHVPMDELAQRVKILLQNGEDPSGMLLDFNESGKLFWPPLHKILDSMALASPSELEKWIECASAFLKHEANVNLRDWMGRTSLLIALGHDYEPMISLFIKHGAIVSPLNSNGFSTLTCDPSQIDWGSVYGPVEGVMQKWWVIEMSCRKFQHLLLKNRDLTVDTNDKTLGKTDWADDDSDDDDDNSDDDDDHSDDDDDNNDDEYEPEV